jgi:FtsP/CotA-like multicopper oxidase with cupredoxin domain
VSELINNDGARRLISRRGFFAISSGAVVALAAGGAYAAGNGDQDPAPRGKGPAGLNPANGAGVTKLALAVTDGWAGMPRTLPGIAPYFPDTIIHDPANPESFDTYIFGFRDVTGLERSQVQAQQGKAQISAPIIECVAGEELWVTLSNLGLVTRPDLGDSHTMHWHGFRNAIPFYDGVPESSVSVPVGRDFTYVFRPLDEGTYMYHCHFEDVEHVTMGMTGLVFVRPAHNPSSAYGRTLDDAAAVDTAFDVEYPILLTEFDFSGHWNDAHIMESDWTNYKPDIWLMNGRAYPDTVEPSSSRDDATGDMEVPSAAHLQYQPISSKLTAASGQTVLIRLANLGFQEQTLTMPGVPLRMVGSDARYMTPDKQTKSDTVVLGAGESRDLIFTAPAPGTYPFYNTDPTKYRGDGNDQRVGGQYTELVVV